MCWHLRKLVKRPPVYVSVLDRRSLQPIGSTVRRKTWPEVGQEATVGITGVSPCIHLWPEEPAWHWASPCLEPRTEVKEASAGHTVAPSHPGSPQGAPEHTTVSTSCVMAAQRQSQLCCYADMFSLPHLVNFSQPAVTALTGKNPPSGSWSGCARWRSTVPACS